MGRLNKSFARLRAVVLLTSTFGSTIARAETPKPLASAPKEESENASQPLMQPVVTAGDQADGFVQRMMGARGALSFPRFNGAPTEPLLGGAMLYERGLALLSGELISARYLDELWIGYDGGGVTYSLSAQLGFGLRWDVAPQIGPFVRFEMRGEMKRQGGWYYSSLRLPGAQLGFGGVRGLWNWEVLAHGGAALTGRLQVDDEGRNLSGGVLGAAFSLAFANLRIDADISRLGVASQQGGIWDARMHLCSYWGERPTDRTLQSEQRPQAEFHGKHEAQFPLALCADASILANSQAVSQQFAPRQQAVLGLSLLLGKALRLDPAGGTCEDATRRCANSGNK